MPKRPDINKVMVIGSGPIVIGQAAEFDYAGTQACASLREEGVSVASVEDPSRLEVPILSSDLDAAKLRGRRVAYEAGLKFNQGGLVLFP